MFPVLIHAWRWFNRVCGFDTVDAFPPGHQYSRTHWNGAYFDIASDLKPDQIERSICERVANTPAIFTYISSPTPAMQRVLLSAIEARMRRTPGIPHDLLALLINAYRSPYTMDVVPGLRALIVETGGDPDEVMRFLDARAGAFTVIEA